MRLLTLAIALWTFDASAAEPADPDAEIREALTKVQFGGAVTAFQVTADAMIDVALAVANREPVEELPCMSIGRPDRGRLYNGVPLPASDRIVVRPGRNFGTPETVAAIVEAVDAVHAQFPDTPPLVIGDLSRAAGGHLRPHVSHQSGRDADLGFYFKGGREPEHFAMATAGTLDRARTWALIEALIAHDKVRYIFIDHRLQRPLKAYAENVAKVSPERIDQLFGRVRKTGVLRHDRGHRNHMHVRFRSPEAIAAATLHRDLLPKLIGRTLPVYHRIRNGDTLTKIARRHRVAIKQLLKWNRLRARSILRPGKKIIVGYETAKPAAGPEG